VIFIHVLVVNILAFIDKASRKRRSSEKESGPFAFVVKWGRRVLCFFGRGQVPWVALW